MKIFSTFTIATILLFTSCSDYLDVSPKDQQTQSQLYSSKSGFYMASNGIYNGLSSNEMYGRVLTYEMLDVMAKRYTVSISNLLLNNAASNNYTVVQVSPVLSTIWQKAYEYIMATNILLENIKNQQGILTSTESQILEGEMLTVRAFLHLDMLRLFGPRFNNNPDDLSIPYNKSTAVTVLPLLSFETVINAILEDLNKAEELLAVDPVINKGAMASDAANESIQLRYRQFRFNYYSTKALKARTYLYAGQKQNALAAAKEVLDDPVVHQHFPSVDPNKLLANNSNPDRVFSSEVLMGIYVRNREEAYTKYFSSETAGINFLQPYEQYISRLFAPVFGILGAIETNDYRYQSQWVNASGAGVKGHVFTKYKAIDKPDISDENSEYFYAKMIPLIRLSELYYIAAESESTAENAFAWLDKIRVKRGLTPTNPALINILFTPNYFPMVLANEFLREFNGEGQAFYFFKRRAHDQVYENGQALAYGMYSESAYRPPLPAGERK